MIDPQTVASEIRDLVADNPAVCRLGIEVLRASGTGDTLLLRARHRDRVITLERDGGWGQRPVDGLATELAHELIAEALSNDRPEAASLRDRRRLRRGVTDAATPGR